MRGLIKVLAMVVAQLMVVAMLGVAEGSQDEAVGERIEVSVGSINIAAAFPDGVDDPMRDWIEERFGITLVAKAEEFIDMCVRFATEDPDGNGEDDTLGFSLRAIWPFHSQTFGYGFTDGSWIRVGDEYHLGHTTRAAFELFSFLRELYQRGGLDPDFILNTGGLDSVDLFATDKAGVTNFQSVPVHYNGFVERWKQFNPDRDFFDHVKVLRPFPVEGYDFHAIGRAGETGFWSESHIAGTVDDDKMSRILDLYNWLYSSEGTMTVMFGAEGQDYRMDGAEIVPLKTDADGNMQVASDLYPIMSAAGGFSYLANWPEDLVQYVNPNIPAAVRNASIAEVEWFHSAGGQDTPVIPAVQAIDVPEKQNLAIDVGASWARFIIDDSGKSNEELYAEMLADWNANGYADAVRAITAAAKEMGL